MPKSEFEKQVDGAVALLSEFLPLKTYLYFPLLYATLKWAIDRVEEWRQKIFSWEVYPDPGFIATKPDAFVRSFFADNPDLLETYQKEMEENNLEALRRAFDRLYPVLGLEDPFLTALFYTELEAKDYKKIERELDQRVKQAREDIQGLKGESRLMKGLETFKDEIVSLSLDMLTQPDFQKMLREIIKRKLDKFNDQ